MPAFLASRLVDIYSKRGDRVFDPFCGTGTVIVESVRLGRDAIGADLSEFGVRVARAGLDLPQATELLVGWTSVREQALNDLSLFGSGRHRGTIQAVNAELCRWLEQGTSDALNVIYEGIQRLEDDRVKEVLVLVLAGALGSFSKRRSRGVVHWGWLADNVVPARRDLVFVDPFPIMDERVKRLAWFVNAVESDGLLRKMGREAVLFQRNWLMGDEEAHTQHGSIDLLLTSPPYPYSIDYTLALRLTSYLFGFSVDDVRVHEIGARYKRKRASRTKDYLGEMSVALKRVSVPVKNGGRSVLVLPHPSEYKDLETFDVPSWLEFISQSMTGRWLVEGFGLKESEQRRIVSTRRKKRREIVAVFRKTGD